MVVCMEPFFLTTVETLDGFSEEWGASWGDLIANTSGTFVFIGQEHSVERTKNTNEIFF